MEYLNKSFSVQMGGRAEEGCKHEWLDPKGHCVMCGAEGHVTNEMFDALIEKDIAALPPLERAVFSYAAFGTLPEGVAQEVMQVYGLPSRKYCDEGE